MMQSWAGMPGRKRQGGWVGIAASVAGPIIAGAMSSDAAGKAADTQANATRQATEAQERQFQQTRADQAPWTQAGGSAITKLSSLLGLGGTGGSVSGVAAKIRQAFPTWSATGVPGQPGSDADIVKSFLATAPQILSSPEMQRANLYEAPQIAQLNELLPLAQGASEAETSGDFGSLNKKFSVADFWADPVTQLGYQFGLDQGNKSLTNSARARGVSLSPQTAMALTRYGTDYAGTKAADSSSRFYGDQDRTFNRLAGVAGSGQASTNSVAGMGANTATNVGNLITSGANARGAAGIAGANAIAGGVASGINNYQSTSLLDRILKQGQAGGGASGGTWGDYSAGGSINPYTYSSNYG